MNPLIIGSAVSGASSLINNAMNSYAVDHQNKQNFEYWKMQQEYNSPKNQMQRLKEAGLNPAMVAGIGNTGNAASAAHADAKSFDFTEVGNIIRMYLDLKKADTDIENTRADTAIKGMQRENMELENKYQEPLLSEQLDQEMSKSVLEAYRSGRRQVAGDEDLIPEAKKNSYLFRQLEQSLEGGKIRNEHMANLLKLDERDKWEFNIDKMLYQRYGITPKDSKETRLIKMLVKDVSGKDIWSFHDTILGMFK